MSDLPMPSDLKRDAKTAAERAGATSAAGADQPLAEPPSAKLIVQLFLVPLVIVALAVGIMFLIGRLAGGAPSFEDALARLRNPGGGRTAEFLVGPGSKQRYMDAKTVADKLLKTGATAGERAMISNDLIDVLDNHTRDEEGDVRHFLLLALGRAWQIAPEGADDDTPETARSRRLALTTLLKYADSKNVSNQKAAILALAYWAGRSEVRDALSPLIVKVRDEGQDLDVRLAAATVLGPLATPNDGEVIDALKFATRDTNPANLELVWAASLSLAQLGQKDVADTILMLLNRDDLAKMKVLDRETDPKNPVYRTLGDEEQQRILINTMLGAARLDVPEVRERIKKLRESDPSSRVRAAAAEVLGKPGQESQPATDKS